MKGIILAGGRGTRLYPMTKVISKQLLPIYDKPLIYYPLSVLMIAGIREILIISTPEDIGDYKKLLGDGSRLGMEFSYEVQDKPRGIADAFIVGEEFIGEDSVCLILGDNFFHGDHLNHILSKMTRLEDGGLVFGYPVKDPRSFGVIEFDGNRNVISIEEKPKNPKSNYAVPGLYFYDNDVVDIAKKISPSKRGELEITSVNNEYLKRRKLKVLLLDEDVTWFDTGTPRGLLEASEYVENFQSERGFYIGCLEEIAWRYGFIGDEDFRGIGESLRMTDYGRYILAMSDENIRYAEVESDEEYTSDRWGWLYRK